MTDNKELKNKGDKCYNSFACITVVLIILFILCSTLFDMLVTKPGIRENISDIKTELKTINERLDHTPYYNMGEYQENAIIADSLLNK